jgi:ribosomal protein L24E
VPTLATHVVSKGRGHNFVSNDTTKWVFC